MDAAGTWRSACVTRAQTIADGTRMIDLVVEGRAPQLTPGCRADLVVAISGTPAIRTFRCIPAPDGRIRLIVEAADCDGRRFMWSLIEGATVRLSLAGDRQVEAGVSRHRPVPSHTERSTARSANEEPEPGAQPVVANSSVI